VNPTVYIETTIPSYYFSRRKSIRNDMVRTRRWWDDERAAYDCFTSPIVLAELAQGESEQTQPRLELMRELAVLDASAEVERVAQVYRDQRLMPFNSPDAVHVAVASIYNIDYVLTWNCKHIANVNKVRHLKVINRGLSLWTPQLITPHQLRLPEDVP
jgi:predicted nucleic acid-binding protein